jgi:hypothetical protein
LADFRKLSSGELEPRVAVPRTALLLLVSTNDTVPDGEGE